MRKEDESNLSAKRELGSSEGGPGTLAVLSGGGGAGVSASPGTTHVLCCWPDPRHTGLRSGEGVRGTSTSLCCMTNLHITSAKFEVGGEGARPGILVFGSIGIVFFQARRSVQSLHCLVVAFARISCRARRSMLPCLTVRRRGLVAGCGR